MFYRTLTCLMDAVACSKGLPECFFFFFFLGKVNVVKIISYHRFHYIKAAYKSIRFHYMIVISFGEDWQNF